MIIAPAALGFRLMPYCRWLGERRITSALTPICDNEHGRYSRVMDMENALKGFSILRHGIPLATLGAGLLSAGLICQYLSANSTAPEVLDTRLRVRDHAQLVNGILLRHVNPEKPAGIQSELQVLQTDLKIPYLLFLDNNGTIIAAAQPGLVGRSLAEIDGDLHGVAPELQKSLNGSEPERVAELFESADGTAVDGLFAIGDPGKPNLGYLFVREHHAVDSAGTASNQRRWLLPLLAALPAGVLAALLSAALRRTMRRRVTDLIAGQARFAGGDLGVRLPLCRNPESGAVAHSFNNMVEDLGATLLLLRRRTTRLDDVLDGLPDSLFIVHEDGSILEQRGGGIRNVLDSPRDFIGRKITELLPAHLRNMLIHAIQDAVLDNKTTSVQYSLNLPAGVQHFEAQLRPIRDEQVIVLIRNITARQASERLLESRHDRLAEVERDGLVGTWCWEVGSDEGTVSEGLLHLLGLPSGDRTLTYQRFLATVHPDDAAITQAAISAVLSGSATRTLQFRTLNAAGEVRHLSSSIDIRPGPNGRADTLQGSVMDVSALVVTDRALDSAFAHAQECLIVVDRHGRIDKVNDTFATAVGLDADALAGRSLWTFFGSHDLAVLKDRVRNATAEPESDALELAIIDNSGRPHAMNWRCWTTVGQRRVVVSGVAAVERSVPRGQVVELHPAATDRHALLARTSGASGITLPVDDKPITMPVDDKRITMPSDEKRITMAVDEKRVAMPEAEQRATVPVAEDAWRYEPATDRLTWGKAIYAAWGLSPSTFELNLPAFLDLCTTTRDRKSLVMALHNCREMGVPFDLTIAGQVEGIALRIAGRMDRTVGAAACVTGTVQRVDQRPAAIPAGQEQARSTAEFRGECAKLVAAAHDNGELSMQTITALLRHLVRKSTADYAVALVTDPEQRRIDHVLTPELPEPYLQSLLHAKLNALDGAGIGAMLCGERVMVDDIAASTAYLQRRDVALESGLKAAVAIPLRSSNTDSVVGSLALYYGRTGDADGSDIAMLESAAQAIAPLVKAVSEPAAQREPLKSFAASATVDSSSSSASYMELKVDTKGTIRQVNAGLLSLLGYEETGLIGRPVSTVFGHESTNVLIGALEQAAIDKSWVGTLSLLAADGSTRAVTMRSEAAVLDDAGRGLVFSDRLVDSTVDVQTLGEHDKGARDSVGIQAERFRAFIHERVSSAYLRDSSGR